MKPIDWPSGNPAYASSIGFLRRALERVGSKIQKSPGIKDAVVTTILTFAVAADLPIVEAEEEPVEP